MSSYLCSPPHSILLWTEHTLSVKQDAVKGALQKRLSSGESPLFVFLDDIHVDSPGRDTMCMWLLELGSQGLLQAQFLSSDPWSAHTWRPVSPALYRVLSHACYSPFGVPLVQFQAFPKGSGSNMSATPHLRPVRPCSTSRRQSPSA